MEVLASSSPGPRVGPAEEEDERQCWICLGGEEETSHGTLERPCACKTRWCHTGCLAHWQLVSAGKEEEKRCRFCNQVLPDWRPALTPVALEPKPSVMSVRYRGVTHRIQYVPGPDGLDSFLATLQSIGIKVASASQVTFLCRSPDTGEEMALRGLKAFDAAAYCASITAAKRLARNQARRRSSGAGSDDMGVHAAHPDSPTAAGSSGAMRCDPAPAPAAAAAAPAAGEAPAAEAEAAAAAAARRTVAHVHAEATTDTEGTQAAAVAAAASAAAAGPAPAAAPATAPQPLLAARAAGRRQQEAPLAPRRGRRQRQMRRARSHGSLWHMVASLASLVLGGRRAQ